MTLKIPAWLKSLTHTLIAILFTGLFFWFLYRERFELSAIQHIVQQTNITFLILGLVFTGIYFTIHGLFYQSCLRLLGKHLPLRAAVSLFLKRFFIGAFLPAGFTVSQYTFTRDIKKYDISRLENNVASTIYLISGVVSYTLILIPTILYLILTNHLVNSVAYSSILVIIAVAWLSWQSYLFVHQKGVLFRLLRRVVPNFTEFVSYWREHTLITRNLLPVCLYAFAVDFGGAMLLLMAMLAFHVPPSLSLAIIGYVLTILLLTISPFEGIGLIEFGLAYMFKQYGVSGGIAVATTLLYRLYQLWLPFFLGFILVVSKRLTVWLRPSSGTAGDTP